MYAGATACVPDIDGSRSGISLEKLAAQAAKNLIANGANRRRMQEASAVSAPSSIDSTADPLHSPDEYKYHDEV